MLNYCNRGILLAAAIAGLQLPPTPLSADQLDDTARIIEAQLLARERREGAGLRVTSANQVVDLAGRPGHGRRAPCRARRPRRLPAGPLRRLRRPTWS